MYGRGPFVTCAIGAFLICRPALLLAQQQGNHPVLDAPGFQQNRDYFSEMPFEHIDTLTGSLVLTFTDLMLPGNAGRDLRFQRTYNSKNGRWTFGIAGVAMGISDPPRPTAETPEFQELTPALTMADGSARKMAWYVQPNINDPSTFDQAISSEFWRFNRAGTTRRVYIPNGDTCDYQPHPQDATSLWVSSCNDTFNNVVTFAWQFLPALPPRPVQLDVTQHLSATTTRQITVVFDPDASFPSALTYDGRTWSYTLDSTTKDLTNVSPPSGAPGWSFTYNNNLLINHLLASVTTPHGGVTTYTYENKNYEGPESPQVQYWTTVVRTRSTSGREIDQPGTWTYTYDITLTGISGNTELITPSGRILYQHGTTESPLAVFDGEAGIMPLVSRVVQRQGGSGWVDVEREERTYRLLSVLSWWNFGTLELASQTIRRYDPAGTTATNYLSELTYSDQNFGDYHHPNCTIETGTAGKRRTTRTFRHLTSPFIIALPEQEQVTAGAQTCTDTGSETFTKSWTYDLATGFKTSETIYGIATTFQKDAFGNISAAVKANDKWTSFQYRHGRVRKITTLEHATERTINPDGTIASENRAGRTTSFTYDGLGRLTGIQPSGANATVIDYDNATGAWVRTTRGASVGTTFLDGFGRTITIRNATGVESHKLYDSEGRVAFEGYPGGGTVLGSTIIYDAIGRVVERRNPDEPTPSKSSYVYDTGGVVVVTDEKNRVSRMQWKAFGNPDEPLLSSVVDANGKTWSYQYNALGRLTRVVAEDGITRSWVFDTGNLLRSETHPESGTTTYSTYDAAGMLVAKTDANGETTAYAYDGNDRVETITARSRVTTITYEPGTDNRSSAINPFAATFWRYDPVTGRLQQKQDVVDNTSFTTQFEYDGNDFLTAIVYPSGRRIEHQVDNEGRPTRIFEAAMGRNYASAITYHLAGGVASYTSGNTTTTTIGYHPRRYWVQSINSGPLQLSYGNYDFVGNPQTIGDARPEHSQTLAYDNLDRLTGASSALWSPSYSYDLHGNRNNPNYQIDPNTLRLMGQDVTTFTYDNNGNMRTAGASTFTYSPQNQVESAVTPNGTSNYAYDSDEQRVKKTVGASTTYFIRGANGELLTEWKDPGTASGRIRDYIYLGTRLVSAVARDSAEDPAGLNVSTKFHRFATSWQVPGGSGGNANTTTGASAVARKSMHPDMPPAGLRLGAMNTAGSIELLPTGPLMPNSPEFPKQAGVFLEFEVERYPYSADAEWLGIASGGNGSSIIDALRLYITPGGQLVLKHDGGRANPIGIWTSAPVARDTRHTLELRFGYNATREPYPAPNPPWEGLTSWVQVLFDDVMVAAYGAAPGGTWISFEQTPVGLDQWNGDGAFLQANLKSPGPSNGLLMNISRAGLVAAKFAQENLRAYGTSWRTTLLQPVGPGTYSQWTGGQPDWRARSIIAGEGGFINPVTTSVAEQKVSYRMASMLSHGITGVIGTVLVGVRMQFVTPNTRVFIRRNGVETILTDLIIPTNMNKWYRVANAGWAPTDVIEVGVRSGDTGGNYLNAVALIVEHNTPEPEPLTDTSARVMTLSYTGNGTAQTVDFGVDMLPTALIIVPRDGAPTARPIWWWASRQGAGALTHSVTSFGRVWPQKGRFHVVDTASDSPNVNGVGYVAIAIFDPQGRYVIPFAVSKPGIDDNYTHSLRYPQSREPATDFTPDFVFGGATFGTVNDTVRASLYKGPGHAGDLTGKLGVVAASDADRIQALGPGTVQFGTTVDARRGEFAFWAGRVSDGVSPTRLMAVGSYVGDGTASRNIALNLNGTTPVFALVVPTNATAKVYRVTGDTTGRDTVTANPAADSITAMGANQLTVGSALNASGVTYDVWTITTGLVP